MPQPSLNGEGASLGSSSHGDHTRMVFLANGRAFVRIPTGALHASTDRVPVTFTHLQVIVDVATGRLAGSTQPVDLRIQ